MALTVSNTTEESEQIKQMVSRLHPNTTVCIIYQKIKPRCRIVFVFSSEHLFILY